MNIIKNSFLATRINQWTKNLLVFLAPLFAFSFETQTLLTSIKAFIAFCLISLSICLAKDLRQKTEVFKKTYRLYQSWKSIKKEMDPDNLFKSDLSIRLKM